MASRRKKASPSRSWSSQAHHHLFIALRRFARAYAEAQAAADSNPDKAVRAVADAKKALVDAEAAIVQSKMDRVWVDADHEKAYREAVSKVGDLNDIHRRAAAAVDERRQVDPEWDNPRYGAAMVDPGDRLTISRGAPPPPLMAHWYKFDGLGGLGGRGGRRCCPARRRRR